MWVFSVNERGITKWKVTEGHGPLAAVARVVDAPETRVNPVLVDGGLGGIEALKTNLTTTQAWVSEGFCPQHNLDYLVAWISVEQFRWRST